MRDRRGENGGRIVALKTVKHNRAGGPFPVSIARIFRIFAPTGNSRKKVDFRPESDLELLRGEVAQTGGRRNLVPDKFFYTAFFRDDP